MRDRVRVRVGNRVRVRKGGHYFHSAMQGRVVRHML